MEELGLGGGDRWQFVLIDGEIVEMNFSILGGYF
jgi:hypothetical protein